MPAMELTMTAVESAGAGAFLRARPCARRTGRSRVIKSAMIAFGGSIRRCVLLDTSLGGVRLYLPSAADVPELATVELPDGESRTVLRRWQDGEYAGFEFAGAGRPVA